MRLCGPGGKGQTDAPMSQGTQHLPKLEGQEGLSLGAPTGNQTGQHLGLTPTGLLRDFHPPHGKRINVVFKAAAFVGICPGRQPWEMNAAGQNTRRERAPSGPSAWHPGSQWECPRFHSCLFILIQLGVCKQPPSTL